MEDCTIGMWSLVGQFNHKKIFSGNNSFFFFETVFYLNKKKIKNLENSLKMQSSDVYWMELYDN